MNRRDFLRHAFSGIAGSAFLAESAKASILKKAEPLARSITAFDETEAFWEVVKSSFAFDPGLYYFNNASLGPSPEFVIDATEKFRRTLDSFPSKYMWGGWNAEKESVREKAAEMTGVSPEEIALIHNTTEGMNLIASSMELVPGDEVILADHEHPSGTIPWQYWQESKGIKLARPKLPILPRTPGELVDVYRNAITSRTKVISLCHMVNTNGMILPVREVSEMAHSRNILVAVDGAQSAGMFRFDLHEMGCDFYAASSHKWMFSPKGVGIFYAKEDARTYLKPLIVASGYETRTIRRFENYNTRNLPEVLGLGSAIDFHNLIGPERKERRIVQLKDYFRDALSEKDYIKIKTPDDNRLSCGIMTVEIEGHDVREVETKLADRYHINCRPMNSHGLNGLRISLSVFNTLKDVDYLAAALDEIHSGR
ncbi:aminotransferase class V-fold PLP-dependent enzyme [candidate division KSB1 bacterium]